MAVGLGALQRVLSAGVHFHRLLLPSFGQAALLSDLKRTEF